MRKALFYILFAALAMSCAEIICYNEPEVLTDLVAIVAYGILHIIFLGVLVHRQIRDWFIVYLFGMLLGLLIEAFIPKVLFFGWDSEALTFFGVAWFETLVLTLFYHPVFSFMVPVYIAKRMLGYPLAVNTSRKYDAIVGIAVVVMTLSSSMGAFYRNESSVESSFGSLIILIALVLLVRVLGSSDDVILKKRQMMSLGITGIVFFAFFFLFYEVPQGKVLPELSGFLLILLYILIIGYTLMTRVENIPLHSVSYRPSYNPLWFIACVAGFLFVVIIGYILYGYLDYLVHFISFIVLVSGIISGGIYFVKNMKRKTMV